MYRLYYVCLVLLADGERCTGDRELDEEDEEERDHVAEEHHLQEPIIRREIRFKIRIGDWMIYGIWIKKKD